MCGLSSHYVSTYFCMTRHDAPFYVLNCVAVVNRGFLSPFASGPSGAWVQRNSALRAATALLGIVSRCIRIFDPRVLGFSSITS